MNQIPCPKPSMVDLKLILELAQYYDLEICEVEEGKGGMFYLNEKGKKEEIDILKL